MNQPCPDARPSIYVVDAFARQPFRGNPAAVCVLRESAEEHWMQSLGAEMNLSETAFVWPKHGAWGLRWFTPTTEVDLCGHATLAAAHVLWETGVVERTRPVEFHTHSGKLTARRAAEGIEMNFPAEPAVESRAEEAHPGLIDALRLSDVPPAIGRNRLDLLVELRDEAAVRALTPDLAAVAELGVRGVIVTSRPGRATAESIGVDFVSRYFAPAAGVPEDPVTGSAHCALGPWWARRLGNSRLLGAQLSARGGIVGVECERDRVWLSGSAVTVLRGSLSEAAADGSHRRI
ncbi:MAG: PhzF family phenazine biosynthesis protein [Gemmatimonadota bacterium]|nr:PhzF family phenazine biosynthesis protein [Gemmatimonadota bacterium]